LALSLAQALFTVRRNFTEANNGGFEEQMRWNAEEAGTHPVCVCKRNIPIGY